MMNYVVYLLYRALGFIIGLLPLGVVIRTGRLVGLLGYFLVRKYRRIALRNLAIAFPDKTPRERRSFGRAHFATLFGNLFAAENIGRLPREEIEGFALGFGRDRDLAGGLGDGLFERLAGAAHPEVALVRVVADRDVLAVAGDLAARREVDRELGDLLGGGTGSGAWKHHVIIIILGCTTLP